MTRDGNTRLPPNGLGPAISVGARVFILDQLSKLVALEQLQEPMRTVKVTPFLDFVLSFNAGISFGLFRINTLQGPWIVAAPSVAVVVLLLVWAGSSHSRLKGIALGAICGGTLGNTLDRLRQGAVTDFIDSHAFGWHWPTFNVADIGIAAGVGLLLLAKLRFAPVAPQVGHPADSPACSDRSESSHHTED